MYALPSLSDWDQLSSVDQEEIARVLAARLPEPFVYVGIELCAMGDQAHCVAFFDYNGVWFALIPGGEVTLGYDRAMPFQPTPAQAESWAETQEEYAAGSLEEYLDYY